MKNLKLIFGIAMMLAGIGILISKSNLAGILFFLLGLLFLPAVSKEISKVVGLWQKWYVRYVTYIGIFLIAIIFIGSSNGMGKKRTIDNRKATKILSQFVQKNKDRPLLKNLQLLEEWDKAFRLNSHLEDITYFGEQYTEGYIPIDTLKNKSIVYALCLENKIDKNLVTTQYLKSIDGYGQLKNYCIFFVIDKKNNIVKTSAHFINDKNEVKEINDLNFDLSKYIKSEQLNKQLAVAEKNRRAKQEEALQKKYKIDLEKKQEKWVDECISSYDGSCKRLINEFKPMLKDPSSFEHIETRYKKMAEYVLVMMTYRAKNSFGAFDTFSISAKVSYECEVIQILSK